MHDDSMKVIMSVNCLRYMSNCCLNSYEQSNKYIFVTAVSIHYGYTRNGSDVNTKSCFDIFMAFTFLFTYLTITLSPILQAQCMYYQRTESTTIFSYYFMNRPSLIKEASHFYAPIRMIATAHQLTHLSIYLSE